MRACIQGNMQRRARTRARLKLNMEEYARVMLPGNICYSPHIRSETPAHGPKLTPRARSRGGYKLNGEIARGLVVQYFFQYRPATPEN